MSSSARPQPVNRVVNIAAVRTFLRLLEEGDMDAWIALWADDADQYYPFGTEMFPHHLAGKDAIYERWKGLPDLFDSLSFPLRDTWVDGDTVIARFDGDCVMKGAGTRYRNSYISVFTFDAHGRIREYSEYFDPILAGVNFGLAQVTYPGSTLGSGATAQTPLVRWDPRSGTLDVFDRDIAMDMVRTLHALS